MNYKPLLLLSLLFTISLYASDIPEGWVMAGTNPQGYNFNLDKTQGQPMPSARLLSNAKSIDAEFGTLMQSFVPDEYLGKRVKLSAWVKSKNISNWSGLWMRIDTESKKSKAFDDMANRAIHGNTQWKKYSIVLDVAEDAKNLSYGILIAGPGEVWVDNFEFAIVDDSIPVTSKKPKTKPINNNF